MQYARTPALQGWNLTGAARGANRTRNAKRGIRRQEALPAVPSSSPWCLRALVAEICQNGRVVSRAHHSNGRATCQNGRVVSRAPHSKRMTAAPIGLGLRHFRAGSLWNCLSINDLWHSFPERTCVNGSIRGGHCRHYPGSGRKRSFSPVNRRRMRSFRTAMATALDVPTMTSSFCARVIAV